MGKARTRAPPAAFFPLRGHRGCGRALPSASAPQPTSLQICPAWTAPINGTLRHVPPRISLPMFPQVAGWVLTANPPTDQPPEGSLPAPWKSRRLRGCRVQATSGSSTAQQ